tara:strand:- start:13128 stop:14879 length:1752 start_codon:yes stop_codon:yes gene_type:complete
LPIQLFGYQIGRTEQEEKKRENVISFSPPANQGAAMTVAENGVFGTYLDMDASTKNESQLITKYRELALSPEGEIAIDDVVNESIVMEDFKPPVEILLDDVEQPTAVKDKIAEEFKDVLKMLDFNNQAYDIFKRWYVDGRLYYHKMIDVKKPSAGIQELRYIDPRKIKKVRKIVDNKKQQPQGIRTIGQVYKEFYLFNERGISNNLNDGLRIAKDSIAYVHSGIVNERNTIVLSHLNKAIKTWNQLRWMEDSVVIYRISRAPERRIFYIDVGNLPKMKAEQYLRDMMIKHKNKIVYDATTGEVKDNRKFQTMMEDFWLPRREGTRGTEISTLPGGENLGQIEDVEYFKRKFYKSLNVPISRIESETTFNIGRASEITRDELKFSKFIQRLRMRFSMLFDDLLETQLLLKGITDKATWNEMKENVFYNFREDNHFAELKKQEILRERMTILNDIDSYVGRYYSLDWVKKNILLQNEEEIKEMKAQMKIDDAEGAETPEDGDTNFGAFSGRQDVAVEPEIEELPPPPGGPPGSSNGANNGDKPKPKEEPTSKTKSEEYTEEEIALIEAQTRYFDALAEDVILTND